MRPADRARGQSPTMPTSSEAIALQDIPEDEIVEDYGHGTTGQEMIVYTMDDQGIMFPLDTRATIADLLPQVVRDVGLSHEADEIFALWLMSPLLEIQLKPHHSPFRITLQWEDLLIKFTSANEDEIARDEPVLMLRRHAMLSRGREKYVEDQRILELLYYEAERNVLQERCPVEVTDVHRLAGLSASIKFGKFDPNIHTVRFYRDHLEEIYPPGVAVKKRVIEIVTAKHREASEQFGGNEQEDKWKLQKVYLHICWELPYYGATAFHGQIETPAPSTLSRLSTYQDTFVYVSINREGVFVIDKQKVTVLLGLLYNEFCWEYAMPAEENNRNCLPCLFLHFHEEDEKNDNGKTKLLQIFSRQAVMMDALIKASKSAHNANMAASTVSSQDGADSVDGNTGSRHDLAAFAAKLRSRDRSSCMANKFKRLSLATFNAQGLKIASTVEERLCCDTACVTTEGS